MTKATPESSDSLVFECDFDEPPEKVWRALTEPELLEAWLAASEPSQADPDKGSSTSYEILSAEPHRLLRYRWRDRGGGVDDSGGRDVHSVVTFELAPREAGGTHLRLTHGEFRIMSAAQPMAVKSMTAARVRPITSGRRQRTSTVCFIGPASWRRAA